MIPIRVALVGLSQSAKTSWARDAHLPYLLSTRGRERYRIVALLNSSIEAALKSIELYNLAPETKAYASPDDLAADSDIDLVVNTTRVDVHYDTIKPSIKAGKAVYVEWPLAENATRAQELLSLSEDKDSHAIVGLQARVAPAIVTLKELLVSRKLGNVISSSVQAFTPYGGGDSISEGLAYFLEKEVGGNPVTIAFGHMIDFVHFVLGEYEVSHSHVQIQRPKQSVVNRETGSSRPAMSNVPDLVSVHGTLQRSEYIKSGASLVVEYRTGPPFPGTVPFVWIIICDYGEIRISSQRGPFLQSQSSEQPIPIEIRDSVTGTVRIIEGQWEDWQTLLPERARSIAKLYDLYAEGSGKCADLGVADFQVAVARHRQLDAMLY